MENYVRCAICNSDDTEIICKRVGVKRGKPKNITNVICKRCGLIYNNPIPSEEMIKNYYSGEYVKSKSGSDEYEDIIKRIKAKHPDQKIRKAKKEKNKKAVEFISDFLSENNKALEIGCGVGIFLSELQKQVKCSVKGIEPDSIMSQVAREYYGLENINNMFFEDYLKESDEKFDMVILRQVFEHLADPNEAIQKIKSILRKNGYLFLAVPNAADFKPSRLLHNSLDFGHLYSYTPHTLRQLLLKHNMKIVKWSYDYVLTLQVVAARNGNPLNAVPAKELKSGSNIKLLKFKLKNQKIRYIFFRLKRKISAIMKLKWRW